MKDSPLLRLIALFGLGLLLIWAGIFGLPGSLLGSIIDPANMKETNVNATSNVLAAALQTTSNIMTGIT